MTALAYQSLTRPDLPQPGAPQDTVSRPWLIFWGCIVTLAYALLWSKYWYPLSDSALYLGLGRALAEGRGFTYMGLPHRLVPPLTPVFFAGIMRLGGSLGAIQASCIVLMLFAHLLCFRALSRWVGQRLALAAVLGTALSYWVFINAFTIMSEPLCLVMFWGGTLALTNARTASRRWPLVIVGCLLLLGAAANRIAATFLMPGMLASLLLATWKIVPRRTHVMWIALFVVTFTVFGIWYRFPNLFARLQSSTTAPTTAAVAPVGVSVTESDVEARDSNGRYHAGFLQGVPRDPLHLISDVPSLAGRWVFEGLAMPSVVLFNEHNPLAVLIVVKLAASIALALCIIGGVSLWRQKQWWTPGVALYFSVFWLQWGTRIKARYMAPITPLLFLLLLAGLDALIGWISRRRRGAGAAAAESSPRRQRILIAIMLGLVIAGNAPAWAGEFYIRHVAKAPFYNLARRGACAELVDICAFLHDRLDPNDTIYMNAGADRRIVFFLAGRRVEVARDVNVRHWDDTRRFKDLSRSLPASAKYLLVFCEDPPWPDWHWTVSDLLHPGRKHKDEHWWRLYIRKPNGGFDYAAPVSVPPHHDRSTGIPDSGV